MLLSMFLGHPVFTCPAKPHLAHFRVSVHFVKGYKSLASMAPLGLLHHVALVYRGNSTLDLFETRSPSSVERFFRFLVLQAQDRSWSRPY